MPKRKIYVPDYDRMEVPSDKPLEDFDTHERRAYLLEKIKEKGSSQLIGRTKMAKKFGTSPSNVTQDILESIARSLAVNEGEDIIEKDYVDLQLKDKILFYLEMRKDEEKK